MSQAALDMCKAWIIYVSTHIRRRKNLCKEETHDMRGAYLL
jgi:hypothetical protein